MNARLVIIVVGASLLVALAGIIGLAAVGQPIPDVLQNIGVGSLTLLGGILVPNRETNGKEA